MVRPGLNELYPYPKYHALCGSFKLAQDKKINNKIDDVRQNMEFP